MQTAPVRARNISVVLAFQVVTDWEVSLGTLTTSVLPLAYAPEDYCAPAWMQRAYTTKMYVTLNEAMSLVCGCLRNTTVSHPRCFPSYRRNSTSGA